MEFLHQDFAQVDLSCFEGFYFYSSFYENLVEESELIDRTNNGSIESSTTIRNTYSKPQAVPSPESD